ncbi:NAD(P)-binding protein [Dasania marina]|uniref:NAD(P)-binding protein n=1 Tax=Dasania marina TaxID=471499 RepID=UPI0030D8B216|tara:strand:+ start:106662 stop:109832 length:3171 start_codon:yes stop_codon:yes gene_type:complete
MEYSNAPSFIYRGGDMLDHPPFQQQNTKMYGFFIEGQLEAIQKCIDRDLNAAAAGRYHFKPLSNYVMLTFANIQKCYSSSPEDINKGWGVENDVCFWVPVGNIVTKNGKEYLNDFYWYTPYIWVNSPIAMVNGRDIYGYPKTIADITLPQHQAPDYFSAAVNSFKHYSPETQSQWNQALSIKNLTPGEAPVEQWDDFVDAIKGIFELADGAHLYRPDINGFKEILSDLTQPKLAQIFLRQLPDGDGQKAAYQAIVEAPAIINSFTAGGLLLGDYEVTIEQVDSLPIAQDLGVKIGAQSSVFNFWMDFGFTVPAAETLVNNSHIAAKQKIAILGGGVASCTAAMALTNQPGWQDKYDITLYQKGWRIGGKGASGRNSAMGERIEEHGLHIWFGFYRNAFEYIQQAYAELNRPEGSTLRTWQDAFKPHNYVVHMEHFNNEWTPWCLDFPTTGGNPGVGTESVSAWKLIRTIYAYIHEWLGDIRQEIKRVESVEKARNKQTPKSLTARLLSLDDWIIDEIKDAHDDIESVVSGLHNFIESLPDEISAQKISERSLLKHILEEIKEWLEEEASEYLNNNATIRHLFIGIDLAITVVVGMIRDDIIHDGYDVINHLDFREWLRRNGANETYTVQSTTVRALYDLIFAFEDGDINQANVEAGTMLRGMLRIGLCYNGSIMWKMQAGMGDTIFTPYYQLLKQRGVKFKFFHEVDELILDPNDPSTVQQIRINRQVDLVDGEEGYHPLVNVKSIGCWPSAPLYPQIVPKQAQLLQENQIDLESFWSEWPSVYQQHYGKPLPQTILEKGKDFDLVIHGMSIGGLPYNCQQLLQHGPALATCHQKVKTVVTQAYQLWTNSSLPELGWQHYSDTGEQPVMTSWTEPVDTWAAMNQLLDKEDWSDLQLDPKNVAYYCGVQNINEMPPRDDYDFPQRCKDKVQHNCLQQIKHQLYSLWPNAGTPDSFDWQVLTSPNQLQGEQRFQDQYWRSNINPSERYVQSLVDSSKHRITTKISAFTNVYFTGDWIQTGLNAGCVEAATMAGLQTSRAICGHPKIIKGEFDFGDSDL